MLKIYQIVAYRTEESRGPEIWGRHIYPICEYWNRRAQGFVTENLATSFIVPSVNPYNNMTYEDTQRAYEDLKKEYSKAKEWMNYHNQREDEPIYDRICIETFSLKVEGDLSEETLDECIKLQKEMEIQRLEMLRRQREGV